MVEHSPHIAVLIPCCNEEVAVAAVVDGFRAALPGVTIHVYDNNSTDRTVDVAQAHGAVVRRETRQGKGNVARRMFADVEADALVLSRRGSMELIKNGEVIDDPRLKVADDQDMPDGPAMPSDR